MLSDDVQDQVRNFGARWYAFRYRFTQRMTDFDEVYTLVLHREWYATSSKAHPKRPSPPSP